MTSIPTAGRERDAWVIEPSRRTGVLREVEELWRYRHVARFFAGRSVEYLYARTQLGKPWIVLRPLLPVFVGALVFGEVMQLPSLSVPYFLFLLSGTIAWSAFSRTLSWATRSLERNRQLIKKVYLPRVILPPMAMAAGIVECLVLIGLLVCSVVYYGLTQGRWFLPPVWGPALALLSLAISLGLALAVAWYTAILQAHARDTRFVLGWILGFWTYFTPVIYPLELVPAQWRVLVLANPMTAVVEAFRAATVGAGHVSWPGLSWSAFVAVAGGIAGWRYFKRAEGRAADKL